MAMGMNKIFYMLHCYEAKWPSEAVKIEQMKYFSY